MAVLLAGLAGAVLMRDAATGKISMPAPVGSAGMTPVIGNATHANERGAAQESSATMALASPPTDVVPWIGFALVVGAVLFVARTHRRERRLDRFGR